MPTSCATAPATTSARRGALPSAWLGQTTMGSLIPPTVGHSFVKYLTKSPSSRYTSLHCATRRTGSRARLDSADSSERPLSSGGIATMRPRHSMFTAGLAALLLLTAIPTFFAKPSSAALSCEPAERPAVDPATLAGVTFPAPVVVPAGATKKVRSDTSPSRSSHLFSSPRRRATSPNKDSTSRLSPPRRFRSGRADGQRRVGRR